MTGYPSQWRDLRDLVEQQQQTLAPVVFWRALALFEAQYTREGPGALTREWEREEFLLVVDEEGRSCRLTEEMRAGYEQTLHAHPMLSRWFRPDRYEGQPVLLAARWLCHLIGLRHPTVEVFIDPPGLDGFTLAQVRGMDKFEAPGCFDIPCAGHVSGVESAAEALAKELGEELNLSPDDLEGLVMTAGYNSAPVNQAEGSRNHEYRYLYQGRLKQERVGKIGFSDGEVAGLCVFAVPELRLLVERFPERVASGLGDAMGYYVA